MKKLLPFFILFLFATPAFAKIQIRPFDSIGVKNISRDITASECSDNQIIKWDSGTSKWLCDDDQTGAGATITVKENNTVISSSISTDDYGVGFDTTQSPTGEINISMDLSEVVTGDLGFSVTNVATISADAVSNDEIAPKAVSTDQLEAINIPTDGQVYSYDSGTAKGEWVAAGTGDITSVGDVASGAAFDGTQGTTQTFQDAGASGDGWLRFNTAGNQIGAPTRSDIYAFTHDFHFGDSTGSHIVMAPDQGWIRGYGDDSGDNAGGFFETYAGVNSSIDLKSAQGTYGTRTISLAQDIVGIYTFQGYDGTNFIELAYIEGAVDGTPGSGDMPGRLGFYTVTDGGTTATERLRIDNTGAMLFGAAGVKFTQDGDGALTILGLGDGFDESLTLNLDDTSDEVDLTSATSVAAFDFNTINVKTDLLDLTGTGTINGLDAIDSTGETTLEGTLDIAGDVSSTGMSSTVIGNDKILEVMLKAVDAAADEECLTYETTTGDFEWQTCGGGSDTNANKEYWWPASATLPLEAADSIPPISKVAGINVDELVVLFDSSTDECRTISFKVPSDMTSGDVTLTVGWKAPDVNTGNVNWDFRDNGGSASGVSTDIALVTHAFSVSSANAVRGKTTYVTSTDTTTTLGWVANDQVEAVYCRDADNAGDTLSQDAYATGFGVSIPRA